MTPSIDPRPCFRRSHPLRAAVLSIGDALRFFGSWLLAPRRVAAVAPSGRALADLITRGIGPDTGGVLELGPGTGVFTQALVDRGVAEQSLTLVEYDVRFARRLRERYPRATIAEMDAADLADLPTDPRGGFGATVCGLGLLSMPDPKVEAILRGAFAHMRPGAPLYLFTYGRRCSVSQEALDRLGLVAERTGAALRNIPPASVYRLRRRDGPAH